jgi:hypothetical protein
MQGAIQGIAHRLFAAFSDCHPSTFVLRSQPNIYARAMNEDLIRDPLPSALSLSLLVFFWMVAGSVPCMQLFVQN